MSLAVHLRMSRAFLIATTAMLALAPVARAAAFDELRPLDGQSTSFALPTGELVRSGEVQAQVIDGLAATVGVGLAEHLDVVVGFPVVPMYGGAQLRVSVFNHAFPLKLTFGAGASAEWDQPHKWMGELFSGALSFSTGRLSARVSSTATCLDGDRALQIIDAGVSFAPWDRAALILDFLRLRNFTPLPQVTAVLLARGRNLAALDGVLGGVKVFLGSSLALDLGLLLVIVPKAASIPYPLPLVPIPMASLVYRL